MKPTTVTSSFAGARPSVKWGKSSRRHGLDFGSLSAFGMPGWGGAMAYANLQPKPDTPTSPIA